MVAEPVMCAAEGCSMIFVPQRTGRSFTRFCSRGCANRCLRPDMSELIRRRWADGTQQAAITRAKEAGRYHEGCVRRNATVQWKEGISAGLKRYWAEHPERRAMLGRRMSEAKQAIRADCERVRAEQRAQAAAERQAYLLSGALLAEVVHLDLTTLHDRLPALPEREKFIVRRRYGLYDGRCWSLAETGKHLGISGERVRQIEARAVAKLGSA